MSFMTALAKMSRSPTEVHCDTATKPAFELNEVHSMYLAIATSRRTAAGTQHFLWFMMCWVFVISTFLLTSVIDGIASVTLIVTEPVHHVLFRLAVMNGV
jgi:hypothetical protein